VDYIKYFILDSIEYTPEVRRQLKTLEEEKEEKIDNNSENIEEIEEEFADKKLDVCFLEVQDAIAKNKDFSRSFIV